MNKPKQLYIIGSGTSLTEGIERGLWDKLKNRFVIGINYSHLYYPNPTIQTFVDRDFYNEQKEQLKKLPLLVGKQHQGIKYLPNTITLKTNDVKYYRDVKLGIYRSNLAGIFTLSLAIYLLDIGQIYLLGFDYGTIDNHTDSKGRRITHFYQGQLEHRGINKTNYYDGIIERKSRAYWDYLPYIKETKCHIYNVSLKSNIPTFSKLSYSGLFEKMDNQTYNQEELREEIRKKLA